MNDDDVCPLDSRRFEGKLDDSNTHVNAEYELMNWIRLGACALAIGLFAPVSVSAQPGASPEADETDPSERSNGDRAADQPLSEAPDLDEDVDEEEADDEDVDEEEADDEDEEDQGRGMVALSSDPDGGGVVVRSNTDDETPPWRLAIGGYIRTQYTAIQNDPNVGFVGRHDGFQLADARLALDGRLASGIGFEFEFDGAFERDTGDVNDPNIELDTRTKDAFIYYRPIPEFRVSVGQFEPPYDLEELLPTEHFLFIEQSVGSRGVQNIEGYNVEGISRTREIGVRLDGKPYYPFASGDDPESLGFSASLAATNGQPINRGLNDNDKLAYYGRANLHWADLVRLGGAYFHNDRTVGERPDRVGVTKTGWTADLLVDVIGITVFGSIGSVNDEYGQAEGLPDSDQTRLAYQAQIGYEEPFLGFQPIYRYAYYDPTWKVEGETKGLNFENDARTHHTVGLNYNAQMYPIRVMLNYTFTQEQPARELKNNRFDAALQLSW